MHSPRFLSMLAVCALAIVLLGCPQTSDQPPPPTGDMEPVGDVEADTPADQPGHAEGATEFSASPEEPDESEADAASEPLDAESNEENASITTEEAPSMPIDVSSEDFDEKVLNADVPVLVDFWAPWCGPCQMMHPVLDELAEGYEGKAVIARLNIDEGNNQDLAGKYEVRAIPFMAIFKDGEVVDQLVGVHPEDELKEALDKAIGE